jgi:hypothetical protein
MSLTIANVFPWGRSFDEYVRMFSLGAGDLRRRIIACADGPASFNSEMSRRGHHVTSCDPLYALRLQEIEARIHATSQVMVELAERNSQRFVWNEIRSPRELGEVRHRAMAAFLADFDRGKTEGRYLDQSLPHLNFPDRSFDLALCSHFLFLYSDDFPLQFHLDSVFQMLRVAGEARIFPLLDMAGEPSVHLQGVLAAVKERGYHAAVESVPYEFQLGGNQMLKVRT